MQNPQQLPNNQKQSRYLKKQNKTKHKCVQERGIDMK